MQAWKGWTASAVVPGARPLTWAEWCAQLQSGRWDERSRREGASFSERELARLSFVRWLYQTGRLEP
jgi:hypothetical protein